MMFEESEFLKTVYEYAKTMHSGQKRKGGKDYITHPAATAEILKKLNLPETYIAAALFHDLLEDTQASEADMERLAGREALEAVRLLTKRKGQETAEYLKDISRNHMALCVKSADRLHNVRSLPEADKEFIKKYIKETEKYYRGFIIAELEKDLEDALKKAYEALNQ